MKKRILLIASLCMTMLGAYAQRTYTFNAVALNVDGLPEQISGVTVNEGAPGAEGATTMGNAIAKQNWDIVAFSEDFDYHNYLVAPLTDYYHIGTWRGEIDLDVWDILGQGSANTDGLGLLVAKRDGTNHTGETYVKWNTYNGYTDQGADGLIKKGFRYYAVSIASGVVIDVYILHMDADSGDKDIAARNKQLTQLATYIKNNKHGRPILIIGDTNCRYTRDAVKTNLIDAINADSRLTIKDVWVEKMWGGEYPVLGAEAMMWYNAPYNNNTGEVVDKIFYINDSQSSLTIEANSYLHNTSFGVSDHYPVIANFTVTDNSASAPSASEKEESWTLEETVATYEKPTWKGEQVKSGTTYYVMNVGSGEYIKRAGWWYAQATLGISGHPITPTLNNGKYELVTIASEGRSLGTGLYMDNTDHNTWTLTPVTGTSYQYYIETNNGVLAKNNKELGIATKDANDDTQKWIFVTEAGMLTAMANANPDYPFNFTPMLQAAEFDDFDNWGLGGIAASNWTNFTSAGYSIGGGQWGAGMDKYNFCAVANTANAITISQSLGQTLPKGYYNVSFEAFYRSRTSSADETLSGAVVKFGSTSIAIPNNQNTAIGTGTDQVAALFRDNDTYLKSEVVDLSSASPITLSVTKPKSSSAGWICLDYFRLQYYGTTAPSNLYKEFKDIVLAKVNETYTKVLELNTAGQAAYDISTVTYRYNNDLIKSAGDAEALCNMVDEAYANALEAHKNYIVSQAIANMGTNGGDITAAIVNPSFELGNLFGWTVTSAKDLKAASATDGTYSFSGSDGNYVFNAWSDDDKHTSYVKQTIKGIPNGLYELKAVLASFGTADGKTHDYRIYLTGNDYHNSVAATGGKTVGQEATLYFLVEDHTATIGAIGGNMGGGSTFIHYWPWEGCFLKADNFRLKYICNVPHGRLKLALMDAENATLDAFGKIALDISSYQTMYENKSLGSSDGKTEAAAVYTALQTAAKAQKTAGADMTWAITNPNFETGDYTGWTCETGGDTKAASQENGTYTVVGADGRFLFNTWDGGTAQPLTQTVSGLANGTYKVTAMVASDPSQQITLTANKKSATVATNTANSLAVYPEVTCTVSDGTLAIEVVGVNNIWYKADDFHLTLVTPAETPTLFFDHAATTITAIEDITFPRVVLQRPIKAKDSKGNPAWSSFVAPFDIPAFGGWDYMKLSEATYTESTGNLSIRFEEAETIEAGVPHMVRCTTMTEDLPQIEMGETSVNTVTKKDTKVTITGGNGSTVTFKGVYTAGKVPQGAFFISDNTFYRAADNSNTLKGFRGYLVVEGSLASKARSMSFRWDDGTTSIDNGQLTNDNEVTTVAIYNEKGMRLTEMQQGINILLMSDGSVVKILVK